MPKIDDFFISDNSVEITPEISYDNIDNIDNIINDIKAFSASVNSEKCFKVAECIQTAQKQLSCNQ